MSYNITLNIQGIIDPSYPNTTDKTHFILEEFLHLLDGIEIGFFSNDHAVLEEILTNGNFQNKIAELGFNTVHVASPNGTPAERQDMIHIIELCNSLYKSNIIQWVSFHLDLIDYFPDIIASATDGLPLLWENLGSIAKKGNSFKEIQQAAKQYPEWGVVFDIAHFLEMKSQTDSDIHHWLNSFINQVKQIHFSYPENLYSPSIVGDTFTTSHSLVHLCNDNLDSAMTQIFNTKPEVITIEGVIPPGDIGKDLLQKEISIIHQMASTAAGLN